MHKRYLEGQGELLCEDVAAFSGGTEPRFLKELDVWAKSLSNRRDVSAKQFALLARADIAKMPEWPTACVKAMLAAPASVVRKDETQMFTMEDVEFMKGRVSRRRDCIRRRDVALQGVGRCARRAAAGR